MESLEPLWVPSSLLLNAATPQKIFKHKKKKWSKMSPNLGFSIQKKKQFNQNFAPNLKRDCNSFLGGFFLL